MKHITVGRTYNKGKVALVECVTDAPLQSIDIKDTCFLLIFLAKGRLEFQIGDEHICAVAPCFLCFDERENPKLLSKTKARYTCIYFHPQFLNVNMAFARLRGRSYHDLAAIHDMFLLKPFLDPIYVVPVCEMQVVHVEQAVEQMQIELSEQRDWYWSCRGRSYFMEVIIALERMYGLMGYGEALRAADVTPSVRHPKLRASLLFMEGHYMERLSLLQISEAAGVNATTLNALAKRELGMTVMGYLMQYRILIAKKQLAFTEVPIKEIADRCGFQTVPHFSRVFKACCGETPAAFRKNAVQKRKRELS